MGVFVAVGQPTLMDRLTRRAVARGYSADAAPELAPGERVLVRERTTTLDLPCVATTHALWLADPTPFAPPWAKVRWTEIERVSWSRSIGRLSLAVDGQPDALSLELRPSSRIPALAAERVSAATIAVRKVPMPEGGTLTVAVKQDADRSVRWQLRLSADAVPDEEFVTVTLAQLRAQFGC